jgi:hypothetical protein
MKVDAWEHVRKYKAWKASKNTLQESIQSEVVKSTSKTLESCDT